MKRFFTLFVGSLAAVMLAACDSDKSETSGSDWFATPVSEVDGTTVEVRCDTKFGAGVLNSSNAGFAYARVGSAGPEAFAETTDISVSGSTMKATLRGLDPQTDYLFYAYARLGAGPMQSPTGGFRTGNASQTPDPDPDPDPDPTPVGPAKFAGWAELPVEVANPDYYYAYHICPDFWVDGHLARNYTVCFSAEHHCPVWVAAPRHDCYEGSANRTNAYGQDPDIPSNLQYNSKSTGGGCNKGHMLGSAERTCTSAVNRQVFYYTNIAPQYSSSFNTGGGGWNILEDWIDTKVCADTTYLVIGTYFEKYTDRYGNSASPKKISFGGRNDVSCPTMFYIAALRTKSGHTGKSVLECSADELMCAVFVRCHNSNLKGVRVSSKDMISVAELEKLTGFTYFANVPNAPKESYSASDWGL